MSDKCHKTPEWRHPEPFGPPVSLAGMLCSALAVILLATIIFLILNRVWGYKPTVGHVGIVLGISCLVMLLLYVLRLLSQPPNANGPVGK